MRRGHTSIREPLPEKKKKRSFMRTKTRHLMRDTKIHKAKSDYSRQENKALERELDEES